ncbi:NUDIX hydrolase [Phaeocystidibacter marisrubri]|uniref:NUDIX hydrolase n=1 Tax=Phaeocystidibacter marisrubri TaxID=1577780 RepID=A0A6L3ZKP9_9FLAO|nr:NUDIX hydrolase [Phaeocystidibacter marisrubri]KAB2818229.1 NUDIX hydrolase [Phaeocystidibacter marisrubri]
MNYCPTCGSDAIEYRIPEGDHRSRAVCSDCNSIHYSNPLMVVGCLVVNDGKVLLARRGIEPRMGFWNLPCGFMENDETTEVGALREVLEETGLEVEIQHLHSVYSVVPANQVYLIYKAITDRTDYKLTPESTEINFFSPDEIPWDEIAFTANMHALKAFVENPESTNVHLGSHI